MMNYDAYMAWGAAEAAERAKGDFQEWCEENDYDAADPGAQYAYDERMECLVDAVVSLF